MAWPSLVKNTACGMGALSHCLLYQILCNALAVKVPDGVAYPGRPVEIGQSYRSTPSTETVIFCSDSSMLMRTLSATGFVASDPAEATTHTFAFASHAILALSQSARVKG